MKKNPIFFNYKISNNGDRLDVFIDGTIVDAETQEIWKEWFNDDTSVSFKSFRTKILDSGLKNIRITINSFGGQIGDAMAMHDFIKQLENDGYAIETIGLGMICSAATYPLSAAKNSKISPNSWYMIHNVSGFAWGDVNEVEKQAQNLRKFNNDIRDFYVNLTGKSKEQIEEWMNAETWFTGKEAVDNGFVNDTTNQNEEFKPINKADWNFRNQNALNVFNSFANKPPVENPEKLIENLDMNKFVEAFVNAFKAKNLVVTEENKPTEPLTAENLTNALNTAFESVNFSEEIQNSVNKFFEKGLPENIQTQLQEIINKTKPEAINIAEDKTIVDMKKQIEDIENKVVKNVGGAKPKSKETTENQFEKDDIGFSGE